MPPLPTINKSVTRFLKEPLTFFVFIFKRWFTSWTAHQRNRTPPTHSHGKFMQSETRLSTYMVVWEPISRTGEGPSRILSVSRLPVTGPAPIRRRSSSTVWNSFPVAPIGPRVWPGFGAPIVVIRISGPFRARFSTSVHLATKKGPCCTPSTWLKTYSWIFLTGNSCSQSRKSSGLTSKAINACSAKYPGCCSPCCRSFSRLRPDRNCSVPWS